MRIIETKCVPTNSKAETSPIYIGEDALSILPSLVEKGTYDTIAILHDEAVKPIAVSIQQRIRSTHLLSIPSGETSKSLTEAGRIAEILAQIGATRRSLLINIGGGVTTDIGGFVASNYMRGIDMINVPTSLLGMVDAAIGGKNAVNVGGIKNLMGSIHHPVAVVEDLMTLQTLPDAQLPEGLAEIIKIASMTNPELFASLERNISLVIQRQREAMEACIAASVVEKMKIVEQDPLDNEERLKLNFGHTIGHAEEALSHWAISHGHAVSKGMAAELVFSSMPMNENQRIVALLRKAGLDTALSNRSADEFWNKMRSDKKSRSDGIRITVPSVIGTGSVQRLTEERFREKFSQMRRRQF